MEGESSFDVENIVSTPTDAGFPFSFPWPDLPLVQPSHMNIDRPRSAIEVAIQSWEPPALSSTPTDLELVDKYLRPVLQPHGSPEESPDEIMLRWGRKVMENNPAVVNAGLPSMNPSELPGIMAGQRGRREKYYLTDHRRLTRVSLRDELETPNGSWIKEGWGWIVRARKRCTAGLKKTYIWNNTDGPKTNWIMNVYAHMNGGYLTDDLVLCHVFEASPDYSAKHKCPTLVQERCNGKHHHDTPFESVPGGSSPMQHGPCRSRNPELTSWMAMFEDILLGDTDHEPDSSMETGSSSPRRGVSPTDDRGKSHKRKKISDVWDYFTKVYARDLEGTVITLAACNHCSKVLTGSSKGGTTHLARHTCPCKLKPVEAGRMGKGEVNVLSSQPSSLLPKGM